MRNENPPITKLLLGVTSVESLVLLIAGVGLLIVPNTVKPEWPWALSPFNALLLGAVYSASLVATVITVYTRRWAPARIVVPMIFLFTAIILVVSLVDLDRFDFGDYSTYIWFFLYIVIPVNAAYFIWLTRSLKPHNPAPLAMPWQAVFLIPTILLGIYGLGLLLAPATFSDFWPWPIDDFHGRMYSVLYLTPALGAILLWRAAAALELLTLAITMIVLGITPIVGLVIVDADVNKVDWSASGTWLWNGSFAIVVFSGLGLLWNYWTRKATNVVHDSNS